MAVLTSVLGYAGLGLATRCYALGIQKRNIFSNLGGHVMFMTAFGAAGYWFHGVEERQLELIEKKKEQILQNRQRASERAAERESQE